MKLLIFLISFFFCIIFSFGQKNIKKYYYWVNKAELEYCKGNHKKSGAFFERAFQEMTPFTRDIYCYFDLYFKHNAGDKDEIIKQAHLLAQRDGLYPNLYKDSKLYDILKIIKDTTQTTVIQSLVDSLQSISDLDQSVRLGKFSYTEEEGRQILLTDSMNLERILSLYNEFGTINENNAPFFYSTISLVLLHNSKESLIKLPFDFLKEEVRKGNLDVRVFMSMYDECKVMREMFSGTESKSLLQYGTDLRHHLIIGETLFIYPPNNIKQINKNRKAIGFSETWDDFKIKLKYTYLEDGFKFVNTQEEIWGSDEETRQAEMETRQKIDNKEVEGEYYSK